MSDHTPLAALASVQVVETAETSLHGLVTVPMSSPPVIMYVTEPPGPIPSVISAWMLTYEARVIDVGDVESFSV